MLDQCLLSMYSAIYIQRMQLVIDGECRAYGLVRIYISSMHALVIVDDYGLRSTYSYMA